MIAIMALLPIAAGLGVWYLRTGHFQEFARTHLISRIEKATGLVCRMEYARFNIFSGRFSIAGLSLSPRKESPGLVSLKVDEVRAAVSVSSLWHLRARLSELNIVHPQMELLTGKEKTAWNPEGLLKTLKMSFRLESGKVLVQDGLVKVNGRKAPFNLSLNHLDCGIRYSKELPSYKIDLEYRQSRLFWENRNILHDLAVHSDLSIGGLEIEFFRFRYHDSLLTGSGSVKNWESPVLRIHAAGRYDINDLVLAHSSIHEGSGTLGISADVRYDSKGVYVDGRFSSRTAEYRKMGFRDLSGRFEIGRNVLFLRDVSGKIAQGSIHVDSEIQLREANRASNRVSVRSKNVPLVEVGRILKLPLLTFENTADAVTEIKWKEGDRDLRVDCDANLHGLTQPAVQSARSTPLNGNVRFTYLGAGDVYITSGNLSSPDTSIQASGQEGDSFHVQMSTTRIGEPFVLIAAFSEPVADLLTRQPDLLSMAGGYRFDGNVRIKSSADVHYRGSIAARNGRWRNYRVDSLAAQADFLPPRLQLHSVSINSGSQAVEGNMDLELAGQEQISSFGFHGKIHQVSIASLKDFGADTANIGGILSGNGTARFTQGRWEGEAELTISRGNYKGEPFDRIQGRVQLRDQRLRLLHAEALRGAARVNAEGSIDLKARRLDLSVRLNDLSFEQIPLIQKKRLPVRGRVRASGDFAGLFDDPAFAGTVELNGLGYNSYDLGNGKGSIKLDSGTLQGDIRIRSDYGNVAVQARVSTAPGQPGTVALEFENLDLRKAVAAKIPPYLKEISTDLKGKAEIEGKFAELSTLKLRGEVDGAHFKIQDYELRNAGRIHFVISDNNVRIEKAQFVGEGTNLALSGNIPLDDTPQLDLNLNGSMNLKLLNGVEKRAGIAGSATLNIRASGSKRDPQIIGRASFQDSRLDYEDFPFQFAALQGDMIFSRNLVRFENVRGATASGTIQLSGTLEHRNAVMHSVNMGISLRNARLPYPKDIRSVVDAELQLSGSGDVQILAGDVNVIRAEYVRSFNLLEQLAGGSTVQSGPLTTEPYLLGLRLNVEIHSDNGLLIDNELTRLRGSMRLTLRGTPAYPSLTGHVEANEGTIFFRGSRFEISHAAADFVDRNRINPVLEIRAEADVKTYRLILDAIGDLEHLNVNIASDPPMSTVDILSLLTTGKTETGITTTQRKSEIVGVSAASVLSENLTGVIGKRVQRIFGLESFRVDPFLAGAENDPTARITISERVSKDLVVTFSRNLSTNQEQIVVIEYDVTKDLSLVATRDEDGKYGLDFRFRKRFR